MFKRITIFILVFVLTFSSMALAVDIETQKGEAAERLVAMGLMTGYEDGSLGLSNKITREEFATLAVRLLNKEAEVSNYKKDSKFKDVKKERWSSGYINIAVNEGLIVGRGDNTFAPTDNITNGEALTILVRLLGYESTVDQTAKWPQNYIDTANKLGINAFAELSASSPASRGDVVLYIDNSLVVKLNR